MTTTPKSQAAAIDQTSTLGEVSQAGAPALTKDECEIALRWLDATRLYTFADTDDKALEAKLRAMLAAPAGDTQQASDDARDAARWRGFIASARIRIIGSAGINQSTMPDGEPYNGYAHFGAEFWTKYGASLTPEQCVQMAANNEYARDLLTKYADIAIDVLRASQANKAGLDGGAQ